MSTLLILGGTAEARALALWCAQHDIATVSSLAGRVSRPALPVGKVRIGGFGGSDGLARWLREHPVEGVVDATHPYAATMSAHATAAARATGTPLVRFVRPGWEQHPLARTWHWVASHDEAREVAGALGERVLLTTGRQTLPQYLPWGARPVSARVVEPPEIPLPKHWSVVLDRGPYDVTGERKLLSDNHIEVLVTKDSGGSYTAAKLEAAASLGVAVVVVRRPSYDDGVVGVSEVGDAVRTLRALPPG